MTDLSTTLSDAIALAAREAVSHFDIGTADIPFTIVVDDRANIGWTPFELMSEFLIRAARFVLDAD